MRTSFMTITSNVARDESCRTVNLTLASRTPWTRCEQGVSKDLRYQNAGYCIDVEEILRLEERLVIVIERRSINAGTVL